MEGSFVFGLSQLLGCQFSRGESLRCNLPLFEMTILCIQALLLVNLLLEPAMVLRLGHDDLETSAGTVQVVVDGIHKLFRRVYCLLLRSRLVASCNAGAIRCTFLYTLRLLHIRNSTDSAGQRVAQTRISLLNFLLLSLGLEALLLGGQPVGFDLVGALVEDLVDDFGAVEKLLEVFRALRLVWFVWQSWDTIVKRVNKTFV